MKSIEFIHPGDYDVLQIVDRPLPELKEGQLLVKVKYAAVNSVDNTVRVGMINPKRTPTVLGNEAVGTIVKGNNDFPDGSSVIISCFTDAGQIRGIYVDGLWAAYIAAYPHELIAISEKVTAAKAASFPVSFFSAQACLNKADFQPGKTVLSLAIGGGVGNAGYQLASVLGASQVITTAGSSSKAALAKTMGFENVIDLSLESIDEGVRRITSGKGVDIVIDSIGGSLTGDALHALARNGVLVAIGYAAGTSFTANITDFVWKGIQMRGQSLNGWFDVQQQKEIWDQLLPLLESGQLNPLVAKIFKAEEVAEAQRYLMEERPFGKVLIEF